MTESDFRQAESKLNADLRALQSEIAALVEQIEAAGADIDRGQRQRQAAFSRGDEDGVATAMAAIRKARAEREKAAAKLRGRDIGDRIAALSRREVELREPAAALRQQSRAAITSAEDHAHAMNLLWSGLGADQTAISQLSRVLADAQRRAAEDPIEVTS